MKKNTCCICGKQFNGYGNNPYPFADRGVACDECNYEYVLPSRISNAKRQTKDAVNYWDLAEKTSKDALQAYTEAMEGAGEGPEKEVYKELVSRETEILEKLQQLNADVKESLRK